jgi:hypothetical protein
MDEQGTTPPDQLVQQIRFGLHDLTSRSGHHEFEEACRYLARKRIASNVLPATGPVSSGGDQGRDFETFRSYLRAELGDSGWFAGLVSEEQIAFLCTLQGEDLPSKFKKDVGKVMGSGTQVDRVVAFCSADMPVAHRHKLISDVADEHSVDLEVWDGRAIAENLADHDTYWIAVRYLSLPAELAPARPAEEADVPQWYEETRERWREGSAPSGLLPELLEIRDGLRLAAFTADLRADLPFWLEVMGQLTGEDHRHEIRQRARYEIAAASMRGLGHLRDADSMVSAFLADGVDESDPARLQDAAVMVAYATTAASVGHSNLSLSELAERREQLRARVGDLLSESPPAGRRARLLQIKGHLALMPDPASVPRRGPDDPAPSPVPFLDLPVEGVAPPEASALYAPEDIEEAADAWSTLADALESTPLFPIEGFARLLRYLTTVLVDQPQWESMVSAVDAAVARSSGGGAAGEGCRDRAMSLLEAGRLRKAIHELHRLREHWWSGDTLRGAFLAMLLLSDAYDKLHMPLAAKHYALAVAAGADVQGDDDLKDLIAAGMLHAAQCSYAAGDWVAALEEIEIGLLALHALTDHEDPRSGELLQHAILTYGMCLRAARQLVPDLEASVTAIGVRFGIHDDVDQVLQGAPEWSVAEWEKTASEQLNGRPFNDLGDEYSTRFAALGTRWTLHSSNDYLAVRATQRLAAAAQILLVELADDDLCLMPSNIDVEVQVLDDEGLDARDRVAAKPSNEGREWTVRLTPARPGEPQDEEQVFLELLTVLSMLLLDVSLLPAAQYFGAIERAFERGLGPKLGVGRPYDEIAEIVPEGRWNSSARSEHAPPLAGPAPFTQHDELAWQDWPGPTFSEAEAIEMAATRYARIPAVLTKTLPRLQQDATFLALVRELRSDGWLDWHILTSAFNAVGNARMQAAGLHTHEGMTRAGGPEAAQRLMITPESSDEADVPLGIFTQESMEFHRKGVVPSLLVNWGLEPRQRTPDIRATEHVLVERYGYWDIDAPHDDPFPNAT